MAHTKNIIFVNDAGDFEQTCLIAPEAENTVDDNVMLVKGTTGEISFGGHNEIAGFVTEEHVDWTDSGAVGSVDDANIPNALLLNGSRSMTGDNPLDIGTNKIINVSAGTDGTDAVNKTQLDAVAGGFGGHRSVRVATADSVNIAGAYVSGVITVTATGALSVDGVAVDVGDRILVKDQTAPAQNGVYDVTNKGDVGVSAVLTRSDDYNGDPDGEIDQGDFFPVEEGSTNEGSQWYQYTFTSGSTLGTTAIDFSIFSNPTDLSANNGVQIVGNVISLAASVDGAGLLQDTAGILTVDFAQTDLMGSGVKAAYANHSHTDLHTVLSHSYYTDTDAEDLIDTIFNDSTEISWTKGAAAIEATIVASSVQDTMIKWATAGQASEVGEVGAAEIPIYDSAGNFDPAADVEAALAELAGQIGSVTVGVEYVVKSGTTLAAGDPVFISAAGEVDKYVTPITAAEVVVGVAETAVVGNGVLTVKVMANDTTLTLAGSPGLTAGDKYFWSGSAWVANLSTFTTGQHIWLGGVASAANKIHVQVQYIMKKV